MEYVFWSSSLISLNLSLFDTSDVINMNGMFRNCSKLTTSITIMNASTTSYRGMLFSTATAKDNEGNYIGQITINYIPDDPTTDVNESTESVVDVMIATKSTSSNILKRCYGDNCPTET